MNAPVTEATAMISVSATPAAIAFNFEETRAWLESELEQYDVVVTADTLADCKKLATELNKLAAEISKRRREAVAEVSGPIKDFEGKAKSLEQMCKDGRQRLLDQVQVFEDETKAKAKAALEAARAGMWAEQEVAEEFRRAQIDDLVKLSTLTKTGKLSATAKQELLIRVNADLKLQQQTQIRLHLLENDSYRAGLAAPLTRAHVETFLFASDEEYGQRLQTMIASELERQKVAEERSRKRFEEEQRRAEAERALRADHQRVYAEDQQAQQAPAPEPEPIPEPLPEAATAAPVQQAQKHAYGPLDDPRAAAIAQCTQAEAEAQAIQLSANAMAEPFGIWTPNGLIAIAYGGAIFRKQ
jgi:hypothetical protein